MDGACGGRGWDGMERDGSVFVCVFGCEAGVCLMLQDPRRNGGGGGVGGGGVWGAWREGRRAEGHRARSRAWYLRTARLPDEGGASQQRDEREGWIVELPRLAIP